MPELDDHELLANYVRHESQEAFATLVRRYVNLVYSTALRFVGNAHHAEEITQAVFIILARKATKLSPRTVMSGWLYQTARLTAANFVKSEMRRQRREQEAYVQSTLNESDAAAWEQIAPLLDEAMGRLGETDRNAVVLRFFENKTAAETAVALKTTEAAIHKRVSRALEKLRKIFTKRGFVISAATVGAVVSANSVQAAPAGVVVTAAVAAAKGTAISTSMATLVKGTLKLMAYTKLKLGLGLAAGLLLVGGATKLVISRTAGNGGDQKALQGIARQALNTYAALTSYSDSGTVVVETAGTTLTTTFNIRLQRPNFYRIDWAQSSGNIAMTKGVVWSAGTGDFMQMSSGVGEVLLKPEKQQNRQMALAAATGVSSSAAATIPYAFFNDAGGNMLRLAATTATRLTQEPDARIGGVNCYAFTSTIDPSQSPGGGKLPNGAPSSKKISTTFWIGKRDHLIHQVQQAIEMSQVRIPTLSDDEIKRTLTRMNKPATPEAIATMRKQVEATTKAMQGAKYIFTQTHENIVVNEQFSPTDFAP